MLKLATLIRNVGEPASESRYDDPKELAALGYTGRVFHETAAMSGVPQPDVLSDPEMRRWVEQQQHDLDRSIDAAVSAGLDVYLSYDALVLAKDIVERQAAMLTCKGRPDTLCPASDRTINLCMDGLTAMLERWPQAAGVVLRFGDTDARRLPYLIGNDLYLPHCPRCNDHGRADRIVRVISAAYERVVERPGKRLIARAWNVRPGGMHDTAELAQRVVERLPGDASDDRLVLSFKFAQTDFWRYQPWNAASLACGGRPVMYELQCQREFEGKGGIPSWQAGLWRDGCPEMRDANGAVSGLAESSGRINFAGVMAWVRGGGWGGPFVDDESWIDANAFAAPRLADDPTVAPETLAEQWAQQRLGMSHPDEVAAVSGVLARSPDLVRRAFYVESYARSRPDAWHPAADWITDDLLDVEAAWRMVQGLPADRLDATVDEKRRAADLAASMRHDFQIAVGERGGVCETLLNTLIYQESFAEAVRDLMAGLVAYRRMKAESRAAKTAQRSAADQVRRCLLQAQSHWNHHNQRHGNLRGTATPFRELGLWELTQQIMSEVAVTD
ncbi:MAG: hypothetical protein AAGJ38_02730 [Planctomycetota bacterium]